MLLLTNQTTGNLISGIRCLMVFIIHKINNQLRINLMQCVIDYEKPKIFISQ